MKKVVLAYSGGLDTSVAVAWLKEHIGEERIFQLSGYRLEDHPVLVNLLWEKRNRDHTFENIEKKNRESWPLP